MKLYARVLGFAVTCTITCAAAGLSGCSAARMTAWAITPREPFDAQATPPAPDYRHDDAWLALPGTADAADVTLPMLPAATHAAADVFFVHSTSSVAPRWNTPWDDADVRAASIRGGTLIQASAFNACAAIYAPSYRQASGTAFVSPTDDGARAIDVAYADVEAAWDAFRARTGTRRPFILAGHSQGAVLLARLLRERIAPSEDRARLVAAYLPGAPLGDDDIAPLTACTRADEVGCVVAFNARGPAHERGEFEMGVGAPEDARVCVNPVRGVRTDAQVPRAEHGGAVFFDSERPALLPRFAASRCDRGRLVVTERGRLPKRGFADDVLLWVLGGENLHPIEYQLFYVDVRLDAVARTSAFMRGAP